MSGDCGIHGAAVAAAAARMTYGVGSRSTHAHDATRRDAIPRDATLDLVVHDASVHHPHQSAARNSRIETNVGHLPPSPDISLSEPASWNPVHLSAG